MAVVRRKLVEFPQAQFVGGYEYDTDTLEISRIGGRNLGPNTVNITIRHTSGTERSYSFIPFEGVKTQFVGGFNWVVERVDWSDDYPPFEVVSVTVE